MGLSFRSARPRGTRRELGLRLGLEILVSIRAPARDATRAIKTENHIDVVSIRAPARDATVSAMSSPPDSACFDPRARAGRDALAPCGSGASSCFDPRARAGRDNAGCTDTRPHRSFDPRARAGRDIRSARCMARSTRFDPRARAGRDEIAPPKSYEDAVSIRAPARDATAINVQHDAAYLVSIRAPARDATAV